LCCFLLLNRFEGILSVSGFKFPCAHKRICICPKRQATASGGIVRVVLSATAEVMGVCQRARGVELGSVCECQHARHARRFGRLASVKNGVALPCVLMPEWQVRRAPAHAC